MLSDKDMEITFLRLARIYNVAAQNLMRTVAEHKELPGFQVLVITNAQMLAALSEAFTKEADDLKPKEDKNEGTQ